MKYAVPLFLSVVVVVLALVLAVGSVTANQTGWPFGWLVTGSENMPVMYRWLWLDFFIYLGLLLLGLLGLDRLTRVTIPMVAVLKSVGLWLLLMLMWAAWHDVASGEPQPYEEYVMLILGGFVLGFVGWRWYSSRSKLENKS